MPSSFPFLSGGDRTPTFPVVSKDQLYEFLATCQQDEVEAKPEFHNLLRSAVSEKP
ncbi:hypothetical protein [Halomicronema hongdechloris]|uniref:hypothetical protein n=1 Tax=Halomicronema hongdechloris TaxID=1209493 RepID=UPI0016514D98|nr:hypothetical protein [Halomicronema hongdechloris]